MPPTLTADPLDARPAARYRVPVPRAPVTTLTFCVFLAVLPGCLERTIRVTSDPPGALVWLNDTEIGRTPAEARFKFYGTYDVRVELPGYEPIHEGRDAKAPFYEYPGPDFVAAALPARIQNTVEWHFDLTPSAGVNDPQSQAAIIARAQDLRDRLGPAPSPAAEAPSAPASDEPHPPLAPEPTPAPEPEPPVQAPG